MNSQLLHYEMCKAVLTLTLILMEKLGACLILDFKKVTNIRRCTYFLLAKLELQENVQFIQ